jgi:hypothetical protein
LGGDASTAIESVAYQRRAFALQQCFPATMLTGNGICTGFSILVPRMQGWEQRKPRASPEITREEPCVN